MEHTETVIQQVRLIRLTLQETYDGIAKILPLTSYANLYRHILHAGDGASTHALERILEQAIFVTSGTAVSVAIVNTSDNGHKHIDELFAAAQRRIAENAAAMLSRMRQHQIPTTLRELYAATDIVSVSHCVYSCCEFLEDIFPEDSLIHVDMEAVAESKRLEVRYVAATASRGGYRVWELASVWFDNNPFMAFQRAGRAGKDHRKRFMSDRDVAKRFGDFLRRHVKTEYAEDIHIDTPLGETLTSFHSMSLLNLREAQANAPAAN